MAKLVSIITVVYNDEFNIENTIRSVLSQSLIDFQYVVIDGGSSDGTLDKINKFKESIDVIVSEPDDGVYDAMNKGILLAEGKWIIFMNSGDLFFNDFVLEDVFKEKHEEDVIYGNHVINNDFNKVVKPRSLSVFWKGLPFNHQASFVRSELYKKYLFDLKYRISSVYDFFYKLKEKDYTFKYLDKIISIYDLNGISATSYVWLIDNWNINIKYSKKKIHLVFGALVLHLMARIKRAFLRKINKNEK